MYRSALNLTAGIALVVLSVACGADVPGKHDDAATGPAAAAAAGVDAERAQAIFNDQICSACHGENLDGREGAGPALHDLGSYFDVDSLAAYIKDPQAFHEAHPNFDARRDVKYEMEMPSFDELSEQDRRTLARWLLTR